MIRTLGIISKPRKADLAGVVPPLLDWLHKRGIEVCYDRETADAIGQSHSGDALDREQVAARADLLVVLGGDGTLLHAARLLDERDIPVLAINLGGLGFLTSFPLSELYPALELALSGKLRTSERKLLQVEVVRKGQVAERHRALNDAVVNKGALARILDYDLHLDGSYACSYKADGIIISTPTGSTAYSLSAGGPILYPVVDALVITPICPHALTNRPLVIPDTVKIELTVREGEEPAYLTIDGQVGLKLERDDRVVVTTAKTKLHLIRSTDHTYFEILRNKLKWGAR
jgi:NAD+ kinase